MTEQLSFFVAGKPVTQGGMRPATNKANGRPILITTGGDGLRPWRNKVRDVATLAVNTQRWAKATGPVEVTMRFLLAMPANRPAAWKRAGIMPSFKMPDLDKLVRAIGDSMKLAGVYVDDGQISTAHTSKYEVWNNELIGVEVVVANTALETTASMERLLERRRAAPRQRLS